MLGLRLGRGGGSGAGRGRRLGRCGCCCLGLGLLGGAFLGQEGRLGALLGRQLLLFNIGHQGGDAAFYLGLEGYELVLRGLDLVAVLLQLSHLGGVGIAGGDELGASRAGVGGG